MGPAWPGGEQCFLMTRELWLVCSITMRAATPPEGLGQKHGRGACAFPQTELCSPCPGPTIRRCILFFLVWPLGFRTRCSSSLDRPFLPLLSLANPLWPEGLSQRSHPPAVHRCCSCLPAWRPSAGSYGPGAPTPAATWTGSFTRFAPPESGDTGAVCQSSSCPVCLTQCLAWVKSCQDCGGNEMNL